MTLELSGTSLFSVGTLIQSLPAPLLVTDQDVRILQANVAAVELLGMPLDSLLGKPLHLAMGAPTYHDGTPYPPDRYPSLLALRTRRPVRKCELLIHRPDGTARYVLLDVGPILDAAGSVTCLLYTCTDITDYRHAPPDPHLSEERFAASIELAPEAIVVYDAALDRFVDANGRAEEVFGRSREQLLREGPRALWSADKLDAQPIPDTVDEHNTRALAGEEVLFERVVLHPQRGERRCAVRLVKLPAQGHSLLQASLVDITDRNRIEEQLRTLSLAVEQSPVSVVITDPSGAIEYVNPRFCEVTGYTAGEALGQNPRILQSGRTDPELYQALWRTLLDGGTWQGTFINKKKSGELYWEQASISPIHNRRGIVTHFVAVKEDISARMLIEAALKRANRALAAITACNEVIVRAGSEEQLLATVCAAVVDAERYQLAWVGFKRDDPERSVQPMAWAGPESNMPWLPVTWGDGPTGKGPAGSSIRSGRTQVAQNLVDNPNYTPWRNVAIEHRFASSIGVPLTVDGEVIGALCINAPEPDAFDLEEQRLLERLADDLAYGIAAQRVRAERERVAAALLRSEARFRASFEQAAVGMVRVGPGGETLEVNDRLCQIAGYSREELLKTRWPDGTHPEDKPASRQWPAPLSEGIDDSAWIEKRFIRKDGAVVWSIVSSSTVRDDGGAFLFRVTAVQDITAQKQAQLDLADSEARFRAMFEQAGVGIAISDATGTWRLVNARQGALLGYETHELEGHHFREYMHPEEREADKQLDRQLRGGLLSRLEVENRYMHRSGRPVWMRVSVGNIVDAAGTYQGAVAMFQDISARKQAEEAVRQAATENALLAAAVENTSVGVVVTDATLPDNPIVYANRAYLQITGYAEHEVLGRNPRRIQGDDPGPAARRAETDSLESGHTFVDSQPFRRKDGTPIWCEVRITPITDAHGARTNFVGLVTDVSEQVRMREELERLALHDQLTGLPNRALLQDRTNQAILQATRQHGHAALLLLDLDHFKEVNDTFGHVVGDRLLQRVAQILHGSLRSTDTVGRLGGDEFAVVLPATDAQGAVMAATTLQRVLSEPLVLEQRTLRPDASIGIALYPEHGGDADALLQHADVAMYQAKRARRTSIVYAPEHDLHTPDRAALLEEVRQAIERGQLRLHYQPLLQLASGEVAAVEALLRWEHPQRGLLYPDILLPLIEAVGLQQQVTRWVLREAVRQQREWQDRGLDLAVQINLAASDLHDERLVADVASTLQAPGRQVRLCLELTEGALMGDLSLTRAVLLRLAAAGAQLAIDDYGTGYSSLSRLARLPVDQLKIDRVFVQGMMDNPVDASIVASTVGLAHSVGVPVVAEGVEDEATVAQLRDLGCDIVQGYFFSRPLPPAELERWLRAQTSSS